MLDTYTHECVTLVLLVNFSAYHLSPNPLIVESRELSSTMQLAPGSLLTASGALQEVRNRIKWAGLIAQHSLDLKLDLDLVMGKQHSGNNYS